MKRMLILAIFILLETTSFATVWQNGYVIPDRPNHELHYTLNDIQVLFSHGSTAQTLTELTDTFVQQAKARHAYSFSSRLNQSSISCALDPFSQDRSAAVEILRNLHAQCLFALQKHREVAYQRVTLSGFPQDSTSRKIEFAGLFFDFSPEESPLHLLSQDQTHLETLAFTPTNESTQSLCNRLKAVGWREMKWPENHSFYLTRGAESVLARKENGQMILFHMKGLE